MASLVTIIVQLCNCSQHGQCVWDQLQDGYNRSNTFQIVACDCEPLYDGQYFIVSLLLIYCIGHSIFRTFSLAVLSESYRN